MSENNIAKNGQAFGSAAYFEEINKSCVMCDIFTDCRDYHYCDQLDEFSERIKENLTEIYNDLKSYARVLPYLYDESRKEMVKLEHYLIFYYLFLVLIKSYVPVLVWK